MDEKEAEARPIMGTIFLVILMMEKSQDFQFLTPGRNLLSAFGWSQKYDYGLQM